MSCSACRFTEGCEDKSALALQGECSCWGKLPAEIILVLPARYRMKVNRLIRSIRPVAVLFGLAAIEEPRIIFAPGRPSTPAQRTALADLNSFGACRIQKQQL